MEHQTLEWWVLLPIDLVTMPFTLKIVRFFFGAEQVFKRGVEQMESDCALSIDSVLLFCMLLTRWLLMNHLYYSVLSHALPWYPALWVKSYLLKEQSTLIASLKFAKLWITQSPWLMRILFMQISLTQLLKRFPFLT